MGDPQLRAWGMPGTRCTRSPCAKVIAHGSHHESTGIPGIPARNGFNGLFRALPGDEFFLSPSSADQRRNNTRSGLRASADLTPATDARTTRLRRTRFILAKRLRRHVHDRRSIGEDGKQRRSSMRASIAHRPKPALRSQAARRCRVHRISSQRS